MDYFDILFAKTNGVSSSSCHNEIEAMLEATVGHSGKNQLSYGSQNLTTTVSGVTFTVDLTAGTVTANGKSTSSSGSRYGILLTGDKYNRVLNYPARSIPNGKYYFCGCPAGGSTDNTSYNVYIIDLDTGTRAKRWDGRANVATDYGAENKNELLINDQSHSLVFNCRVYDTNGQNIIFRPMVWSGDISDDSFEPYITPTDEKKQDKIKMLYVAPSLESTSDEVTIPRTNDIDLFVAICLAIGDTNTTVAFIVPQELFGYPCVNGDFSITGSVVDETHNKLTFGFPNTFSAGKIIRVLGIPNISYEAGE